MSVCTRIDRGDGGSIVLCHWPSPFLRTNVPHGPVVQMAQEKKKERIQGSVCAKDDKWVKKRWHNSSTTAENLDKRQEAEKQNTGAFFKHAADDSSAYVNLKVVANLSTID